MKGQLSQKQREIIGDNCYQARLRAGLAVADVAEQLDKSHSYLYQLENGRFNPPLATLVQLRKMYRLKSLAPLLRGI